MTLIFSVLVRFDVILVAVVRARLRRAAATATAAIGIGVLLFGSNLGDFLLTLRFLLGLLLLFLLDFLLDVRVVLMVNDLVLADEVTAHPHAVLVRLLKPGVVEQVAGRGAVLGLPLEHPLEEGSKGLGFGWVEPVFLDEYLVEGPLVELGDVLEAHVFLVVEFPDLGQSLKIVHVVALPDELCYQSEVVIVLPKRFALLRVEQVVASNELEHHAGQRPDIGRLVVIATHDDLRTAVFARLDNVRVVLVKIAGIAHIAHPDLEVLLFHRIDTAIRQGLQLLEGSMLS